MKSKSILEVQEKLEKDKSNLSEFKLKSRIQVKHRKASKCCIAYKYSKLKSTGDA